MWAQHWVQAVGAPAVGAHPGHGGGYGSVIKARRRVLLVPPLLPSVPLLCAL